MSDGNNDGGFTRRDLIRAGSAIGGAAAIGTIAGRAQDALAQPALPQVPRRKLGKTGREIPILLMGGSMRFDQRFDPKLAEALRFGVNYFDTADCYASGASETGIGNFLERAKARDKVWITTKSDDWTPAGVVGTLKTSLERLKTDHVEMYYLHQLDDESVLNADLEKTVAKLKAEKKIHFFGFSCHSGNVVELMKKAAGLPWIDSIMFRYNFRQYGNQELNAAIDACAKADIGLIAMKTQGSEASFAEAWKKFEKGGKWNKYQAVMKAVWADPRITAAVSHMDTLEKLRQNIDAALDKKQLGAAEREALEKYAQETRKYSCDGCDHFCNPAVNAPVQIGATLRYLMYHDVYGQIEEAKAHFAGLPREAQDLARVDFAPAEKACPHGVEVTALMERAKAVFQA
jgi:hypothetical protein